MKRITLISSIAIGLMTTAASAQTFGSPANASTWSGCYVGGSLGASSLQTEVKGPFGLGVADLGSTSAEWGLGLGCDVQVTNTSFVIGLFGDYAWTDHSSSINPGLLRVDHGDGMWTIGGRLGTLLTDSTLAYGLVGYSEIDSGNVRLLNIRSNSSNFSGITLGGGLETNLGNNLRLGMEYRYTDLDSNKLSWRYRHGNHYHTARGNIDPDLQVVRATLKYTFYTPASEAPIPLK